VTVKADTKQSTNFKIFKLYTTIAFRSPFHQVKQEIKLLNHYTAMSLGKANLIVQFDFPFYVHGTSNLTINCTWGPSKMGMAGKELGMGMGMGSTCAFTACIDKTAVD